MAAGRKTGGRVKGVPNKATAQLKALAQKHTSEALKTLASIMKGGDSDSARVAAAKELLDRGYGKPAQAIVGGDEDSQPIRIARIELIDLGGA
ncbi:hypothetical protein [Reyranella sp.]|uniref:hypothetical protein n=1 Tax=Reyranella sp. TaxID=1929291 RepID=UPI0012038597|nr:hypothetical protein [Reyranella sp.]TAJ89722.1 MAG: hypothetical protein EPO50_04985 [Reyranella sp.]